MFFLEGNRPYTCTKRGNFTKNLVNTVLLKLSTLKTNRKEHNCLVI